MELANIFGGVIDFALDPRAGDTFSVLYEERYLDGEKIGEGSIVAAEYVNEGKSYSAYRFIDRDGDEGYFSADGVSMRKAFLRAPLDFTRVSSNFNLRRLHPVAKVIRPHRGVDYAASTGTPVYASGDGRVAASGYSRANGNYVFVSHANNITTRYLHLHKRTVKAGQRVKQGQLIGTVGSTGLATGPHLHYEFLVNGVHRNPRTVLDNLPRARSLASSEMNAFKQQIAPLQTQLASYTRAWDLAVASNTTP
jgi:murein DD-endopeptidase MepM/ murein hydrolase activator NlpD